MRNLIAPQRMAEIYYYRLHFAAIPEIKGKIEKFAGHAPSVDYWVKVLLWLEAKASLRQQQRDAREQRFAEAPSLH